MEHIDIVKKISKNLERGIPLEEIKQDLLNKGLSDYEINSAIKELDNKSIDQAKKTVKNPETEEWNKDI